WECREPSTLSDLGFQPVQKTTTIHVSSGFIWGIPVKTLIYCRPELALFPLSTARPVTQEGNMAISYSGFGAQITDSLEAALIALGQGKQPNNSPFSSGSIEIRPVGATGNFSNGSFAIVADDVPTTLSHDRSPATTQRDNPCKELQDDFFSANEDYMSAKREGLSQSLVAKLKAIADKLRGELTTCLATNGIPSGGPAGPLLIFRSKDLLRTGNG